MLYLILIIPHLLAIVALLWFGYHSGFVDEDGDEFRDGWDDGHNGSPPPAPQPGPSLGYPPLPDAAPPRRRVRPGEQLSHLYPPLPRREIEPVDPVPVRTPSPTHPDG
ncbi:MAG TPA: hypothetical protein VFW09_13730 [Solirubrobacteraceae bacterium]|nr:hypothetical protein [Solirubrobacteraceae bacterium]